MPDAGIYIIENLSNNKIYVGSSNNLSRRKRQHLCALRSNTHRNKHLQSSFNKYGEENFIYYVLIMCDVENLVFFEQLILDKYNPQYNKRKIAENNSGHKFSDEARKNMSLAHIGNKNPHNKKWREKMSKIMTGRSLSEDHKNKLSAARLSSSKVADMYKDKDYKDKQSKSLKLVWERRRKGILPMPNYSSRKSNEHV